MSDIADDGLLTNTAGPWTEEKHELIRRYAQLFTTSMAGKWSQRVYVDLFAGAGYVQIEGTSRVVLGSPLIALSLDRVFDRYVFCEADEERLGALRERVRRDFSDADVRYVGGDVNERVDAVIHELPPYGAGRTMLAFCVVDPYSIKNLRFATLQVLSKVYVDFLVLIPSGMDALRNEGAYLKAENHTLDEYFGDPQWRAAWAEVSATKRMTFRQFVVEHFERRMRSLGYQYGGADSAKLVRSSTKNLKLYHLAFFSRHPLGEKFWKAALKGSDPQTTLDL